MGTKSYTISIRYEELSIKNGKIYGNGVFIL